MSNLISKISIGSAQFGMDYGIANSGGKVESNEIKRILDFAIKNSIKNIDTAKSYKKSELEIGNYIKYSNNRNWEITTKINNIDKDYEMQFIESCELLSIKPNIVLAHNVDLFLDHMFQKQTTDITTKDDSIKIGVSIYDEKDINKILNSKYKIDVINLPLNILDTRLYRSRKIYELKEKKIELHARSVFLQGLFYLDDLRLKMDFKSAYIPLKKLKNIAENHSITLPELSLLWVCSLKPIDKVIIGVDNLNQFKMHINTLSKKVNIQAFEESLKIVYEDDLLNPLSWL